METERVIARVKLVIHRAVADQHVSHDYYIEEHVLHYCSCGFAVLERHAVQESAFEVHLEQERHKLRELFQLREPENHGLHVPYEETT